MDPTPVTIKLSHIHCYDEADGIGSAEPYLWTVFFKIDGDTAHVNAQLTLQGTATVVTTPGNHGNLPGGVDDGEVVTIPPALGEFTTLLTPMHIEGRSETLPGVVGCIVVLMEQDATPDAAVAHGHVALNTAVEDALNALIPTLNFLHTGPTEAEIKAMTDKVGQQVADAISDGVSLWDWLTVVGDMDDKIGTAVFHVSQSDIIQALLNGIPIEQTWNNNGSWKMVGRIHAVIDALDITCIDKPSGNAQAHRIMQVGGLYNGQPWRLGTDDVIRWIQAGIQFYVSGADGSRSQVQYYQHWTSNANPTGQYIATVPDGSKADNLLSLPRIA